VTFRASGTRVGLQVGRLPTLPAVDEVEAEESLP
jgi:hypothetical protein